MEEFIEKYEKLESGEYIYYDNKVYVEKTKTSKYIIHYELRTIETSNLKEIFQILWLLGYEEF